MEANKALIIVDIQNDYFEGGLNPLTGSMEAGLNAQKLLHNFRLHQMPVVFIKHISTRSDATFFLPDTHGVEIHDCVVPLAEESVLIKSTPNSFYGTQLHDLLQGYGIEELVVCGMMTHMCVDATVRAAKDLGYKCIVIHDACATKDLAFQGTTIAAGEVHNAFLASLMPYYSTMISTAEYLENPI